MTSVNVVSRPAGRAAPGLWLVGIAAMSMALLFGLVATTASPILVGLGAAMLLGAMLLARPVWNIWLVFGLGLLVAGVLPIWVEGAATKLVWGVSALAFVLMLRAWFQAITVPGTVRQTPAFVWIALVFIAYTVLDTLWQPTTAYAALSGFKRYFQATGLLFALAWLPIAERNMQQWGRFVVLVAMVQLPWAVYERIKLVPIREGMGYAFPGMVPIDVVAGTFGANMTSGGANAEMATFLIMVFAFVLARLRAKLLVGRRIVWLAPLLLAPLFLGETKVVVVLLPLMFVTFYRRELLARPHRALAGLAVGALLTTGAVFTYVQVTNKPLDALVHDTLSYNVYERGHSGYVLNRTKALSFWAERQGLQDPAGAVLGHGLGTAHDASGGMVAMRYAGYGISLTAASLLLWEQGALGVALFYAILLFAWRACGRIQRASAVPDWARADAAAIQAVLPLFAFYLIYRRALVEGLPFQIVFWGMLGYLAWLVRRYVPSRRG